MIKISEKEYKKIKKLQENFYKGVDRYCETLEDTYSFRGPFEKIMEIIESARKDG